MPSSHVAAGLQARGIAKGDRVGLCLPNTPFFVVAYYAALRIGAVVVNYNPLYVERELEHQIKDSGTKLMFVIDVPEVHKKIAAVAERAGPRNDRALPARRGSADDEGGALSAAQAQGDRQGAGRRPARRL